MKANALYTTLFFAGLGASTPIEAAASKADIAAVSTKAHFVDLALLQTCKAQSCFLADASGSSGKDPTVMPEGANDEDLKCIFKYNKRAEEVLKAQGGNIPKVPKQDTGISTTLFKGINSIQRPQERKKGETDKGTFKGKCTPNILLFSKGTLEPTEYGITIGPSFIKGWDSTWSTNPVIYDATVSGDFCLALPGGMVAKDLINQAAAKCPTSNIYVAGYSQGAMVVRNGVAYANSSARARVKVSSYRSLVIISQVLI
jgi:hypothetical protein